VITEVTAKLESANFSARPMAEVMRFKYAKLLTNLSNALNAACPASDAAKKIRKLLRLEGEAVLTAAGIDFASRKEEAERRGDLMQFGEVDGVPRGGGSSWQSVMRGTGDIETDYLNGEITYFGRLYGVATPANQVLQRVANELARQKGAAQSLDASDLLAEIEAS
jgi:2-dehydropantoate 2-reductase